MSWSTYFVQECTTCGRTLQIRVEYLGRIVVCQHCGGKLLAQDPANYGSHREEEAEARLRPNLLRRADELLSSVEQFKQRPR